MISYFSNGGFVELDTSGNAVSAMRYSGIGYNPCWDFANPGIDKSMFITGLIQNPDGT